MVVLVALLVALGALVVGLLTSSVVWLVVSIVVCLIAIALVVLRRSDGGGDDLAHQREGPPAQQPHRATAASTRPPEPLSARKVVPTQPLPPQNVSQATASGHPASRSIDPPSPAEAADTTVFAASAPLQRVWVIDGRPRYHRPECAIVSAAVAEEIPRTQAVEDGFIPCALCDPDATLH